jgi:RNA polymerase sigma factor (sigma-70 family)
VTEIAWIDAVLRSARPQAVSALLRYFRELDQAEEAFQEACLRALKNWPVNGPPRDPTAWLIMVGRNCVLDDVRRQSRNRPLPADEVISDLDDAEADLAERLDSSHYRDDVVRLLFICCHPDLPATQQIALALRIVSGLSVKEIARAFLVSESAMEQRITRAKGRVAKADVPFARSSEPSGSPLSPPWSISCSTRVIRRAAARSMCACRCARKPSGWLACCCGCFRASPRSWVSRRCSCFSTRGRRPGSMRTAASFSWRSRIAAYGTGT